MERDTINCAIMFADIVGSTALYSRVGDGHAQQMIASSLGVINDIARLPQGIVIKTIGDELMCRFPCASSGIGACCRIQEAICKPLETTAIALEIKIGIHAGEVILQDDDVFGDAVNIAARMTAIAGARQIITTEQTYLSLNSELQAMARQFDQTAVKGKAEAINIYDILWEEDDDLTRMASASTETNRSDSNITLSLSGQQLPFQPQHMPLTLGRSNEVDVSIDSPRASRIHARLEYHRGKFVLTDQSTNGTYVKLADGKEIYLRREALPLSFSGEIYFGENSRECRHGPLYFVIN